MTTGHKNEKTRDDVVVILAIAAVAIPVSLLLLLNFDIQATVVMSSFALIPVAIATAVLFAWRAYGRRGQGSRG